MKLLKGLIVGMGVLIVLGVGLLAWGVYQKTGGRAAGAGSGSSAGAGPGAEAGAEVQAFGHIAYDPGPGCVIADIRPEGNRLWLRIGGDGPGCQKAAAVDLKTGAVLGTVGAP